MESQRDIDKHVSIKFRKNDTIRILFEDVNGNSTNTEYPRIVLGPVIDRVKCVKCWYLLTLTDYTDIRIVSEKQFKVHLNSDQCTEFTALYKDFKKVCKIESAHRLVDGDIEMTDEELMDDLDFMKNEIITCQINMNMMKQRGEMEKYQFYDDMINIHQHDMFQIPTPELFVQYMDKIAKILEKEHDIAIAKEKEAIDNVRIMSQNIW